MLFRDRREAAIATRKKTIVPHSMEPPYLTRARGSPRPSPNPRRARPDAIIARHRQARTINVVPKVRSRVRRFETVLIQRLVGNPGIVGFESHSDGAAPAEGNQSSFRF